MIERLTLSWEKFVDLCLLDSDNDVFYAFYKKGAVVLIASINNVIVITSLKKGTYEYAEYKEKYSDKEIIVINVDDAIAMELKRGVVIG